MKRNDRDVNSGRAADITLAAESALLLALTACPAILIPFGDSPFEAHKGALLWVAAATSITASLIGVRRWLAVVLDRPWMRSLLVAAVASAVALAVSVVLSQAPALSWWGSGLRRYGGSTQLAFGGILVSTVLMIAADPTRVDRCVASLVLGSIGPTVYAIAQTLGIDPLALEPAVGARPTSTFGNPLFLSGYLAAAVPMTMSYAMSLTAWRKRAAWGLVALQGAAIAAARSSGPLLAMAVATALVGALVLAARGRRRPATAVALGIAGAVVAVVLSGPLWIHAGTTSVTALQALQDRNQSTIGVRMLLWQAAGTGIRGDVRALALGTGPESTVRVLTQHSGSLLRLLEGPDVAPDRSHNETLDTTIALGLVGLAARLAIIFTFLGAAFAALGLLPRSERNRFMALAFIVTFVLPGAMSQINGVWTLAVSVPGAVVTTAALWIAWRGRFTAAAAPSALVVPIAAATACWLTHYLEIQTGIASIGSALIAVTAGAMVVARDVRPGDTARAPATTPAGNDGALAVLAGWASAIVLIGLIGAGGAGSASAWIVAGVAWAIAAVLVGGGMPTLAVSAAVGLATTLAWSALRGTANGAIMQGLELAGRVDGLYLAAAACFATLVWQLAARRSVWSIAWVGVVAAALVAGRTAITVSAADVLVGAAHVCEEHGDLDCAVAEYAEAARRDPHDERAFARSARVLVRQAELQTGEAPRDALFEQAVEQLARAWAVDPFDYHNARNRGGLERGWARLVSPAGRERHLEEADRAYGSASGLAPSARTLWAEWANLKLERGRPTEALERLEHAAELGAAVEAASVGDALLGVMGIDVNAPGGLARAAGELRARGCPRLADLYMARSVAGGGAER